MVQRTEDVMNEAEQQLLLAIAYLPGRVAALMGWPVDVAVDQEHLEAFSAYWFDSFREPWDQAYQSLADRALILADQGVFSLTPAGRSVLGELTRSKPLFWYEYNLFYARSQKSPAHSEFCRRAYGEDLQQHGLADITQLRLLLDELGLTATDHVLDAGCGSGRITAWLQQHSGAHFWGIDLSPEGISQARRLEHEGLRFSEDNLLSLSLPEHSFDVVIAVDTIYYVPDIDSLLAEFLKVLRPQGRLGIFCNNWIMPGQDSALLSADGSLLAQALKRAGLTYRALDISAQGKAHWKHKLQTLEDMQADFLAEGSQGLFAHRRDEALRYANWPEGHDSRYLYLAQAPDSRST